MLQNTYLIKCFAGVFLHDVLQHTPVAPGRVLGDKPAGHHKAATAQHNTALSTRTAALY
jgi:hypothetical protein